MVRSRTSTRQGSTSRSRRSARPACTSVTTRRRGHSRAASTSTSRTSSASAPTGSADSPRFRYRTSTGRSTRSSTRFDVLELDGVSVFTNADGSYLGDSRFDPIFAELQRRGAIVFVHPTASPDPIAHTLGLPDTLLDYPVDTSRAIAKLHYSNTFARTPDVKYVFVHAGGTIPYLASRFAIVDEMDVIPGAQERGAFADVLPRLYWDTASAFSDPVLHMLRSVTGLGNVVFGTDYPYPRDAISIGGLRQLENTAELDDGERRDVLGGSAARLIPRLARVESTL